MVRQHADEVISGGVDSLVTAEMIAHLHECDECAAMVDAEPLLVSIRTAGWPPDPVDPEVQGIAEQVRASIETRLGSSGETLVTQRQTPATKLDLSWLDPPIETDELGRLGNFRVLRLLGHGGMGAVFEADDLRLQRSVALKVILPGRSNDSSMTERFLREARAAAAVHHRHVVTIFEVGQAGNVPYLAMELLQGESLEHKLLREQRLEPAVAVNYATQVAEGLAAAHAKGLIHRDIKPANIWVEADQGQVKLLDFGLARTNANEENLTASGMVMGTPAYMAPEQARGEPVDARSDLFSLGCVVYRMLTGQKPFVGQDVLSTLNALANAKVVPPRDLRPEVPAALDDLVLQLLEKSPAARPVSAEAVIARLAEISRIASAASLMPLGANPQRRLSAMSAGLAAALILCAVIVITIRNRDGSISKYKVDTGKGSDVLGIEFHPVTPAEKVESPAIKTEILPAAPQVDIARSVMSLDHFDPAQIPESERIDGPPEELVVVIGENQLRHWGPVVMTSFHPGGDFFITLPSHNKRAVTWLTKTLDRPLGKFEELNAHSGIVFFSQNGRRLFTNNQIYSVDATDAAQPKFELTHTLRQDPDLYCATIHNNRWLLMASAATGDFEIWDVAAEPPRFVKKVKSEWGPLNSQPSWSSDGSRLIGKGGDMIRIWDIGWTNNNDPELTLRDQQISAADAKMSFDGRFLVTRVDGQPKCTVWRRTETGYEEQSAVEAGLMQAFSSDSKHLAVGSDNGIALYQLANDEWTLQRHIYDHMGRLLAGSFSPDDQSLVLGNQQGSIYVWDLSVDPPQSKRPIRPAENVANIVFSPDGRSLIAQGSGHRAVLWKLDGAIPEFVDLNAYADPVILPTYSGDSRFAFITDRIVDLANPHSQGISQVLPGLMRMEATRQSLISLENNTLFRRDWKLTKRGRCDVLPAEELWASPVPLMTTDALESLQFESRRFATRHEDQSISVWCLDDPAKPLFNLKHDLSLPFHAKCLTLSSAGNLLLAFSQGGSIVWDLEEFPPREYRLKLDTTLNSAFFSRDSRFLFVSGGEGVVIHDWALRREVRRFTFPGPVRQIVPHPDEKHLATVNGNGTIYFLRVPELLGQLTPSDAE